MADTDNKKKDMNDIQDDVQEDVQAEEAVEKVEITEGETNDTETEAKEAEEEGAEEIEESIEEEVVEEAIEEDAEEEAEENEEEVKEKADDRKKTKKKDAPQKDDDVIEDRRSSPASIKFSKTAHPDAKWFVVHTYSGHERKVAITLRERVHVMNLQDRINEVLIPTQKRITITGGKKKEIDERMFPGYILVRAVIDDTVWHAIRSTPGVTGFVGIGNRPTPLSNKEVDSIIKFMKIDTPKFEAKFRDGDSVKITDGAFKDFVGKVSKVMTDQGRLEVLVSVFDRETPVEVDFTQVQPE